MAERHISGTSWSGILEGPPWVAEGTYTSAESGRVKRWAFFEFEGSWGLQTGHDTPPCRPDRRGQKSSWSETEVLNLLDRELGKRR
jgi:hypothetical protein